MLETSRAVTKKMKQITNKDVSIFQTGLFHPPLMAYFPLFNFFVLYCIHCLS